MTKVNEIWKPVTGYIGLYEVSNFGNIKRIAAARGTTIGHIFHPGKDAKGYLRTRLTDKKGKGSTVKVHRIVCLAFHSNHNNFPQVNHKNGIKSDNRSDNLEWTTNRLNVLHAKENGLLRPAMKGKFGFDHNKTLPLKGENIDTGEIRIFAGTYDAARQIKSNVGSIWRVRKGIYEHTKRWKFEKY